MRRLVWIPVLVAACGSENATSTAPRQGKGSSSGTGTGTSGDDGTVTGPDGGSLTTAGASTCTDPSLLFCDDFESYGAGPAKSAKWESVTGSSSDTLTIDATKARAGKALHVHVTANEFAYAKVSFKPPSNSYFGRAYVWTTAFPTAPDYAHFTLVEAAGDPESAGVIRPLGGQYDPDTKIAALGVGSDGGPTGDWTNWKTSAPAKSGAWVCFEWEMQGATDTINVSIDGAAKTELGVTKTRHGGNAVDFTFPSVTSVWFGWWLYQDNPKPSQYDLWYDDVAFSTKRLGCF